MDSRRKGTKCAPYYTVEVPSRGQVTLRVRFFENDEDPKAPYFGEGFDKIFEDRIHETDQFYEEVSFEIMFESNKTAVRYPCCQSETLLCT